MTTMPPPPSRLSKGAGSFRLSSAAQARLSKALQPGFADVVAAAQQVHNPKPELPPRKKSLRDYASLKKLRTYQLLRPGGVLQPATNKSGRFKRAGTARWSVGEPTAVVGVGGTPLLVGDPVWLRDVDKSQGRMFVKGTLTAVQPDRCTVATGAGEGGVVLQKAPAEIYPAHPYEEEAPEDNSALIHLNEPCILENTRQRYAKDLIYTYTGRILVAVNPFRELENIYSAEMVEAFATGSTSASTPPHVFAVAERAYVRLRRAGKSQVVVMSGESGAGKTETAKHTMLYLAQRNARMVSLAALSERMVQSNPITEAFGNAKTLRNDNSSRFGKYTQVYFTVNGAVAAAAISTYLLERPRVTRLAGGERSYHIFYQLLAGATQTEREAARLGGSAASSDSKGAADFAVLRQSGCTTVEGVDDATRLKELRVALETVGVDDETVSGIFGLLSGVLYLGNLEFEADGDEGSKVKESKRADAEAAAALLGCNPRSLAAHLTSRVLTAGHGHQRGGAVASSLSGAAAAPMSPREMVAAANSAAAAGGPEKGGLAHSSMSYHSSGSMIEKPLTPSEAARARDACSKVLYVRLFAWLQAELNASLRGADERSGKAPPPLESMRCIGLLDIFGFERCDANGFE